MVKNTLIWIVLITMLAGCVSASPQTDLQKNTPTETSPIPPKDQAGQESGSSGAYSPGTPLPAGCSSASLGKSIPARFYDQDAKKPMLAPFDPQAGQFLCSYTPIELPENSDLVSSRKGERLVIIGFNDYGTDGTLTFVDMKAWESHAVKYKTADWFGTLAFSSQADQFAFTFSHPGAHSEREPEKTDLALMDIATGTAAPPVVLGFTPYALFYTPDGQSLIVYGGTQMSGDSSTVSPAHVAVIDTRQAIVRWEQTLPDLSEGMIFMDTADGSGPVATSIHNAAVLSKDGQRLYIVHAQEDKLTTLDLETRSTTTADIRPKLSWLERLLEKTAGVVYAKAINGTTRTGVLSPDGSRLYVTGFKEDIDHNSGNYQVTPSDLLVIDPSTATEITRLGTGATSIQISSNGRYLFLHNWSPDQNSTSILNADSLEVVAQMDGQEAAALTTQDGEDIYLASAVVGYKTMMAVLNPDTFAAQKVWAWPLTSSEAGLLPWARTQ